MRILSFEEFIKIRSYYLKLRQKNFDVSDKQFLNSRCLGLVIIIFFLVTTMKQK